MKTKKDISIIRSSASEYLTFVAGSGNSDVNDVYTLEETSVIRNFRITAADGKDVRTRAMYSSHGSARGSSKFLALCASTLILTEQTRQNVEEAIRSKSPLVWLDKKGEFAPLLDIDAVKRFIAVE